MSEPVMVTVMKRYPVNNECNVFMVEGRAIGFIDENNKCFYNDKGALPSISNYSNQTPITYVYANAIDLDKLRGNDPNITFNDRASAYLKEHMHYVTVVFNENGKPKKQLLLDIETFNKLKDTDKIVAATSLTPNTEGKVPSMDVDAYLAKISDMIASGSASVQDLLALKEDLTYYNDTLIGIIDNVDFEIENHQGVEEESAEIAMVHAKYGEDNNQTIALEIPKNNQGPNIDEIYKQVLKTLIAQDEPAYRVITEIIRSLDEDREKDALLLTGSTGVGKSLLMSLIAKYVDRPYLFIDSTQLTKAGYVGRDIETCLWELYESCGRDLAKAERAIVFFDEIDKKGSANKSDIAGKAVLDMLLKFLDGVSYNACPNTLTSKNTVTISTKNMIVVAGGAFTNVYKVKKHNSIGFESDNHEETYTPTITDFVEKGHMTDEFMGRCPVIVHMNDLTPKDLRRILLESNASPIEREEKTFAKRGVKFTATPEYLDAVSEKAYEMGTGARALKGIVSNSTWRAYAKVSSEIGEYVEVIVDEKTVTDEKAYQLVKKSNKK